MAISRLRQEDDSGWFALEDSSGFILLEESGETTGAEGIYRIGLPEGAQVKKKYDDDDDLIVAGYYMIQQ